MKIIFPTLLSALIGLSAQGAIVHVKLPAPVEIYYRGGFGTFQPFDLDQNGQQDIEFVSGAFIGGLVTFGSNRISSILLEEIGGAVVPAHAGDLIGVNGVYAYGGMFHNTRENLPASEFGGGYSLGECAAMSGCGGIMIYEDGYIGVEFSAATGIHYGWIRWKGMGGLYTRIDQWAWETEPGVPIIAGAVPEPGEAVLLSTAALVVLLRRKRPLNLWQRQRRVT